MEVHAAIDLRLAGFKLVRESAGFGPWAISSHTQSFTIEVLRKIFALDLTGNQLT